MAAHAKKPCFVLLSPPSINGSPNTWTYTYDGDHRLLTSVDPLGQAARTSTYDDAGRLATDTDALGNVTKYAYDVSGDTTTTTYPDTGVMKQTFDNGGCCCRRPTSSGERRRTFTTRTGTR